MNPETKIRRSGEIYSDILYRGLLAIRGTQDIAYANALADHLHNVPNLMQNLEHAGLHDYYWNVMRPEFISRVGSERTLVFDALWKELEAARKIETKIL